MLQWQGYKNILERILSAKSIHCYPSKQESSLWIYLGDVFQGLISSRATMTADRSLNAINRPNETQWVTLTGKPLISI